MATVMAEARAGARGRARVRAGVRARAMVGAGATVRARTHMEDSGAY